MIFKDSFDDLFKRRRLKIELKEKDAIEATCNRLKEKESKKWEEEMSKDSCDSSCDKPEIDKKEIDNANGSKCACCGIIGCKNRAKITPEQKERWLKEADDIFQDELRMVENEELCDKVGRIVRREYYILNEYVQHYIEALQVAQATLALRERNHERMERETVRIDKENRELRKKILELEDQLMMVKK